MDRKQESGFSLLELLIVLAILSFLATSAFPAFQKLEAKIAHHFQARRLFNDIADAKRIATLHQRAVTLCALPSNALQNTLKHNSQALRCAPSHQASWHDGWMLFFDENSTFSPTKENLIRLSKPFKEGRKARNRSQFMGDRNIQSALNIAPGRAHGKSIGTHLGNGRITLSFNESPTHEIIINVFGYARVIKY